VDKVMGKDKFHFLKSTNWRELSKSLSIMFVKAGLTISQENI